ncbi:MULTISPECIES: acyltransferase family protein [Halopseudomonas]|uniref:Acyltransferase n=1 Tax=Halopseudomonas bauzanensis TaxID=653930 RepID=A0A4U0YLX6_9GAMM|nr:MULTISPECIES: acyltransferase [Halopseudomonas]TKA92305.1 acyltransferase [Halopseudomonas bauzanensis]WGK62553.1 acyltransferase [Halopseudomonas sp. SMJS2]
MSNGRILDIEVLRGLAVIGVVIHHARDNLFTWSSSGLERLAVYFGGWVGVDLFFVISGFVIARTLLPQLQARGNDQSAVRITLAFWIRRAWRLLPSAWLWLLIMLLGAVVFRDTGTFGDLRANLEATVAGFLNVANLRFLDTFMQSEYGASFVYWSLSLEEQFYFLLPLVVLLSRRWLVPVLILIVLYQLLQERTLAMMVFRCDGMLLGVLLAIWSRHPSYQLAKPEILQTLPLKGTIPLLFLLGCLALLGSDELRVTTHRVSVITLLCVLLVWIASYNENLLMPAPLHGVFTWLGARSFAIYLIHIPAFFLTREIWSRMNPGNVANSDDFLLYLLTAGGLIIVCSELNHRWVEQPLRRKGRAIAQRMMNETTSPGRAPQPQSHAGTRHDYPLEAHIFGKSEISPTADGAGRSDQPIG